MSTAHNTFGAVGASSAEQVGDSDELEDTKVLKALTEVSAAFTRIRAGNASAELSCHGILLAQGGAASDSPSTSGDNKGSCGERLVLKV